MVTPLGFPDPRGLIGPGLAGLFQQRQRQEIEGPRRAFADVGQGLSDLAQAFAAAKIRADQQRLEQRRREQNREFQAGEAEKSRDFKASEADRAFERSLGLEGIRQQGLTERTRAEIEADQREAATKLKTESVKRQQEEAEARRKMGLEERKVKVKEGALDLDRKEAEAIQKDRERRAKRLEKQLNLTQERLDALKNAKTESERSAAEQRLITLRGQLGRELVSARNQLANLSQSLTVDPRIVTMAMDVVTAKQLQIDAINELLGVPTGASAGR